jgi:MSHA type pilus biogenesis protein MshL
MKRRLFSAGLALLILTAVWPAAEAVPADQPMLNSSALVLNHPNLMRKVSLALNDTNLVDAIVYLAEKADLNIAVAKTVQGRATLSFKDVSIRDAFEILLVSNDLACEKRGDILYVLPAEDFEALHGEKWAEPRRVKLFKLQYSKPSEAAAVLASLKSKVGSVVIDNDTGTLVVIDTPEKIYQMEQTIGQLDHAPLTKVFELRYGVAKDVKLALASRVDLKTGGALESDDRTNRIVVTALPEKMREIESLINQLDVRSRQVLIEAKIISVTLEPDMHYGIDWQRIITSTNGSGRVQTFNLGSRFPLSAETIADGLGRFSAVGPLAAGSYSFVLQLLSQIGETKILSSPRITALNNQEAKILVGTREAFITEAVTQGTSTTNTSTTVNFVDVGVQLKVTPTINQDGFVTMKIRPEISRVARILESGGNVVPIVDTTNAETSVIIKDGHTIIIGGLIKDEKIRTERKIPGLGDIPVIGHAFKGSTETQQKVEIVVFLTPHILDPDKSTTEFPDSKIPKPMRGYDEA